VQHQHQHTMQHHHCIHITTLLWGVVIILSFLNP
jgi:cytochrome c oxidase subunit IV